jgi:hypothetical protein
VKNFPPPRIFFGAKNSPTKNYLDEEFSGEESSKRGTFRRIIFLAKKYPSEELSGEESSGRRIFRLRRIFFRAKNSPAKNHPSEELSGEELSGEEYS